MGDKKNIQDYYAFVCRTCLKSSGEMQSLAALINDNVRHGDAEISYMDCLQYCMPSETRTEGDAPLPTMICIDCASALQVAYWFMKNASKAQEVLKIRIKELQEKQKQLEKQDASATAVEVKKPKRYRCKVCNTKLETKRSLKDHVKLHLDIIAYNCQLCTFEHHQRNYLIEHYQLVHGVEATAEQLKPKTKTSPPTPNTTSTTTTIRQNDNFIGEQQQPQQLQQQTCEVYVETTPTHNSHDIIYATTLHQPQQNQNFVYTTTSVNSTDVTTPLEGNATTTIFAQPNAETFTFNAFEGDLNVHNDPNVGNEFIVMADGSVENVMGKGVVIEYINSGEDGTTLALENGLVLDNILQVQNPTETTNMIIAQQNDMVQMDVDDLIIEDPENTPEQTQDVPPSPIDEDMIPATFIEQPKRNNCKICAKEFDTQDELKTHMLTHSEIPHFFCDQCTFYTFFKIDLHQHYKSKHNLQPTSKQLQPKNKQSRSSEADMDPQTKNAIVQKIERYARSQRLVYSCDICFYECDLKYEIRRHYLAKHRMNVQDVQQRPTRSSTNAIQPISNNAPTAAASTLGEPQPSSKPKPKMKANAAVNISTPIEDTLAPDYINGLNCRKCNEVFFYRNKLYEHYKLHSAEEGSLKQQKQALKVQKNNTQTTVNSLQQTQATAQLLQNSQVKIQQQHPETQIHVQQQEPGNQLLLQQTEPQLHLQQQEPENQLLLQQQPQAESQLHLQQQHPPEIQLQYADQTQPQQHLQILQQLPQPHQEVVITTTPLDSSLPNFNNVDPMSLVLTPNNNPAAPLTPSSSSTYTLPSDAIPQVVEMEQTIETDMDFDFNGDALFEDFDDVDVENESDDNDLRNVVLTSDDDFDDMLKEQGETQTQTTTSYCAQCQKSFLSQYQFENHMFLHRGLAPYRCEMCTNLYNTKRALIRHYNAIHKKIPSRDMIQAKGDKVYVYDKTPTDYLTLEESKAITLMCAKCTYESTDFPSVQLHLNTNHSIHDDSFILRKLSYECPRCIRSFSTKAKLLRHLERNHAATPINHPPIQINSIDTATTTTTTTTAPSLNNNVNMMQMNATSEHEGPKQEFGGKELETNAGPNDESTNRVADSGGIQYEQCITPEVASSSLPPATSSTESTNEITFANDNNINATVLKTDPDSSYSSDPQSSVANTNVILYRCQICQSSFTSIEAIRLHSKSVDCRNLIKLSKKDRPLFKCEVCESKYATMYLFRHHLKRHMARTFRCSSCPKSYLSQLELDSHQSSHTDERPHQCDKCPNSFRYAHHLKRHKNVIHFGKRYMCPETNCNRQFTTMDQVRIHKWSHGGTVPYKCRYCQRLFKKRLLLRKHCWKFHKRNLSEEEVAENNNLAASTSSNDNI